MCYCHQVLKLKVALLFLQDKLLTLYHIPDTAELKEPEKVRASQEKALQALQAYTLGKDFEIKIVWSTSCLTT